MERAGSLVFNTAVNFTLKENITTTEFVGVGRDGTILLPSTCTFTLNGHTFTGNKLGTQSGAKIITSFTPEGLSNGVPSSINKWFGNGLNVNNGTIFNGVPNGSASITQTTSLINQKLGSAASLTALATLDESSKDYVETLETKKLKAIAEINTEVQQAIYSGFPYEIDGQEYFIGYSLFDQANLNGDAVVAMQNPGKVMPFRCTDDTGNPVWLDIPTETILDIQKYGIVSHRDMIRREVDGKKARIMAAASEEEIKAIIME